MRIIFQSVLFLLLLNFFRLPVAFSSTVVIADTGATNAKKQTQNPSAYIHIAFTYGRANFNSRQGVVAAFAESGYPYHVISQADPSAKAGQPVVYSITGEVNISKQVFVGAQFSKTLNQEISGSNWIGAIQASSPIPVEQFDVAESYATKFVNGTINYIVVPVNFIHSRWELTVGAGLSYNKLKVTGMQRFERHPNIYTSFDDTSASYKFSKNGFGYLFGGSMDFYWSRSVSNQFKVEFRHTPSLEVPAQSYKYVTTRSRVRVIDTQTLRKHSLRYSGVILSFAFRFHI